MPATPEQAFQHLRKPSEEGHANGEILAKLGLDWVERRRMTYPFLFGTRVPGLLRALLLSSAQTHYVHPPGYYYYYYDCGGNYYDYDYDHDYDYYY